MQETVSRNAACPCGSGKKYKRCCGKDGGANAVAARPSPWVGIVITLIIVGVGVGVTLLKDLESGLGAAGGTLFIIGIYFVFRNPPPPKGGSGDPAGLNFGR